MSPTATASRWPSSWWPRPGGGEVSLVSMAPNNEVSGMRTALAMGAASAILVSDPALKGTDALGTAKVLAAAIARKSPDLVLAATESSDGYTGTVPAQVAELLGLPSVTFAKSVAIEGGVAKVRAPDRGGLRRGRVPVARTRERHRRRRRASLPELQGHHGRQVQAGRHAEHRRSRHRCRLRRLGRRRSGDRRHRSRPLHARPARRSKTTAPPTSASSRSSKI